jgi:hypothetical protein
MPSRQTRRRPQAAAQTSLFKQPSSNQLTVLPRANLSVLTALLARLLQSYRRSRAAAGSEGPSHG